LVGGIKPEDVRDLASCNGRSVWVESSFAYGGDPMPSNLVLVYAEPAPAASEPAVNVEETMRKLHVEDSVRRRGR
jgi:hypothetical protein